MNWLKKLLGMETNVNIAELLKNGATIVDVRSPGEFQMGHVKGSINIPLDKLPSQASELKKKQPIITCCASGMRSASAKNILTSKGLEQVYNGGGWSAVEKQARS
jgi:phage shock protein E